MIGAAALTGAIGAGGQGIASGITGAVTGAQQFNRDDKKRLRELEALRRTGQLGLSSVEKARVENDQAASRGGMLRTQQSQQAAANQALANQQALSGREMFMASLAGQEAEATLRGEQAQAMADMDMQARNQQLQEIGMLNEQKRARRAAIRGGITQALTAGLVGAGAGAAGQHLEGLRADKAYERYEKWHNAQRGKGLAVSESQQQTGRSFLSGFTFDGFSPGF
jgi:hypothetical protein